MKIKLGSSEIWGRLNEMVYTECVYHCASHSVSEISLHLSHLINIETKSLAQVKKRLPLPLTMVSKMDMRIRCLLSICATSWLIHKSSLSQLHLLMNSPEVGDTFSLWIFLHDEGGLQNTTKYKNSSKKQIWRCLFHISSADLSGKGSSFHLWCSYTDRLCLKPHRHICIIHPVL